MALAAAALLHVLIVACSTAGLARPIMHQVQETALETRLLVRAHVAVRGAASAGAVGGGESPQGAIEPAHPALQVVAVGTGEALGLDAVARQAGAVAGVTRALRRLVETVWAIGPAAPLVEVQFNATFGAADAVIAVPPAGFTVGRTFLTQVGSRVSIGTSRTLHHTGSVLVQEISFEARGTIQCLWTKAGLAGRVA